LQAVASTLEPKPQEIDAAAKSQQFLRAQLQSGTIGNRIRNSWLIGSYARRTVVTPIDDIDIFFELDPDQWSRWSFQPDPSSVLKSLSGAIRYRYPNSGVRTQRRSIGLMLSRRSIDVVPGLPTNDPDVFLIPDRIDDEWIPTAPRRHADVVNDVNRCSGGLLVPTIKLMKSWNQGLPSTARLKSFAIETIVTRMFREYDASDLADALRNTFDFIVYCGPVGGSPSLLNWSNNCGVSLGRFITRVPDVTGLRSNAIAGVEPEMCIKFVEKARISRDRIQAAMDQTSAKHAQVQIGKIFNCKFA
jgi:hypothetical protein